MKALTTIVYSVFAIFAVAWVGPLPIAHAVSPPPDGGYPGQNTAEGQSALLHLAGGTYNTALGWSSLGVDVTGNLNTAVGAGALLFNTADQNTATGAGALLSDTTDGFNTATGALALFSNAQGDGNTANGNSAFKNSTTGNNNTATGYAALVANITGADNTANGTFALFGNAMRSNNVALVFEAGYKEGKPCSVRYDQVNAMLPNEFLKEHRKVERLEAAVAQQRKDSVASTKEHEREIRALTSIVKEQTVEIQRVRDNLERREAHL